MMALLLVFALVVAVMVLVAGWDMTSPDGKGRCRVENSPPDRHRKAYLESRGWFATPVQGATSRPKRDDPPPDVPVVKKAEGTVPPGETSVTPSVDQAPFEVFVEANGDDQFVIKTFSIEPGEEVYFSKSTKAQLLRLCEMVKVEFTAEDTVEVLKSKLTAWANAKGAAVRFIG